jgi:FkbM family methyltransferase
MGEHDTLAHRLRLLTRRLGVDVIRFPGDLIEDRGARLLRYHRVSVVLDVGAGIGQYAGELRALGYRGRLVSYEPLTSSFETLRRKAARDGDWVAVRTALGDAAGTAELNVAGNSHSSSILPMLPAHEQAASESRFVGIEQTPVARLDEIAPRQLTADDRAYVRIAAQGYAKPVLLGAKGLLDRVVGMQVQLPLLPLYDGEMLFQEGVDLVTGWGYALMGIKPGFHVHESGRTLQVDAVFYRE